MTLRSYQQQLIDDVEAAWAAGAPNVIGVLPTGAGKTMTMSAIAAAHANEAGVAIAHRSVLIGQISMALARAGVPHDLVASKAVVKTIVSEHMEELGRSLYVPGHKWKVASVDTLPGRAAALAAWMRQVTIGFTDESHHLLSENKWGRACLQFDNPAMRWFLPTATPERGDRKGLGRHADGIADALIEGPSMRWHIDNGYLTDYIIRCAWLPHSTWA